MNTPTKLKILLRYGAYLLWEFRWALSVFWGLVFIGGLLVHAGAKGYGRGYLEDCHGVFLMVFLEGGLPFPDEFPLQVAFFLIPIVGLGAIADSIVRLAYLVFTQKRKLQEWQRMVASLYRNHIVVVGVGKVGLGVIRGLVELGEAVVAVEQEADWPFMEEVHALGVPVIHGNGRQRKTLEQAGVANAKAVLLVTDDDLANLDSALTSQEVNPKVRVVLRLFDETLANRVTSAFSMPTVSTSQVSAPAFIAAATGRKVYHDFELGGQHLCMTDLTVGEQSGLAGQSVGRVQDAMEANVVMLRSAQGVRVNPPHDVVLAPGDTLFVIAPRRRLAELEQANRAVPAGSPGCAASPGASGPE
jgi:Trk K+ transport system NAD-binding subunit